LKVRSYRLLILISIILLLGFALYLNTYYKSLFNTLDPKPGNETISFYKIEENLKDKTNYFTWLGQSTILLSIDNKNILFDPIFSMRASPFSFVGPKRSIPLVIKVSDLPRIDHVFISHNHYDHLDMATLKTLQKDNPDIVFNVPLGDKKLLTSNSLNNVKLTISNSAKILIFKCDELNTVLEILSAHGLIEYIGSLKEIIDWEIVSNSNSNNAQIIKFDPKEG